MKWLEKAPLRVSGITFGHPWQRGELEQEDVAALKLAGDPWPHEARTLAYWPDGSVKWTGHAAVVPAGAAAPELDPKLGEFHHQTPLAVAGPDGIMVDTGAIRFTVPRTGSVLTGEIRNSNGELLGNSLRLLVRTSQGNPEANVELTSAVLETPGAVRSVVKAEGTVLLNTGILLTFVLRLAVFAGQSTISVTQTLLFTDAAKDRIIKGIGLCLDTPMSGELFNRYVSFAGDEGVYTEPVQSLYSRPFSENNPVYAQQLDGIPVPEDTGPERLFEVGTLNAVWGNYRLTQESEDYFRMEKQSTDRLAPVRVGKGRRSQGLLYAGHAAGGAAVSLRGFWQKNPAALEVDGVEGDAAALTAWCWAESVEPMDLRHYAAGCFVDSAYEGFDEMRATPEGVANTSHISFDFLPAIVDGGLAQELWLLAQERQQPAQAVCAPESYYKSRATGVTWGLPHAVNTEVDSIRSLVEQRLAGFVEYYAAEVEQRSWYGYWNFGDFMHTYDQYRHQWRYDMGGYAWANNELAPNMWLWQYFLRTGDATTFRLAEAMTWHSAEVDRHHNGTYAQLGSRHNVSHWGCGCKEVRISMAGLHKYYYFLTGDERIGELLSEVRDAQHALDRLDPMREFYERPEGRTHIRIGPDWSALTSNWFSEWERTGDTQWRDWITKGIDQLKAMPMGLLSGPTVELDTSTGDLHHMQLATKGGFHMIIAFGAPQVWMEIADVMENGEFSRMIAEFGRFYALSEEAKLVESDGHLDDSFFSWPSMATGMMAFAASYYDDAELARKVWDILIEDAHTELTVPLPESLSDAETWVPVKEYPHMSTNWASQWCLNAMLALEMIGAPGEFESRREDPSNHLISTNN
ncbi:hypothetical protein CVS30_07010 [Arthrobacter psychrolactophilus]|uniref:Tat pathway signal sequence domain protein n=1 Tax=Arthrobacter psychrolactophilus TaxID=92442 RepID=A0A2V5IXP3_9MICC|nr:hypothetical protein [Arthrobacter psychrolactophilus]PYI39054.1 hypothetical protein CVS30_07010 [Arthrobacter psychrolactophilus]